MAALSGSRANRLMWLTAAALVLARLPAAQGTLPEFFEHPRTVVARPGTNVSFTCRANPVGTVLSWISDGIILINGSEAAFGKVVIQVANDVQAGLSTLRVQDVADGVNVSFRCLASIPGRPGVIASKAAVLVKARLRPFRKSEDSFVGAASGNTVSIRCSVPQSIPPATFVFEKNGTTIDESNGRYHLLPNGELQITQVQSGDSGPYRCVAVNEITMQKVEASNVIKLQVYDPVAGEPPVPVRYAPRLTVVEGGQVLLPCLATGSPPPVITWEKFGSDSLSGGHSQLWLGNLRILKAEETDAGTYLCRAENEHAKANPVTTVTMLDVVLFPRIIRTPTEQVAEEGASAAFRCTLRRGVEQTTTISWLHDGYPVGGGGSGILIENGTDGGNVSSMLTIGSVQIRHQGVYQCLASNSAGEETAHALLRVHEAPAWRKQSPWPTDDLRAGSGGGSNGRSSSALSGSQPAGENGTTIALLAPSVTQQSSSEVIVRWSASDNLKKASRSFRVEMKNQSADWVAVFTELPVHTAQVTVGRLKLGAMYRFRIVAALVNGRVLRGAATAGFRLQLSKSGSTATTTATQPDAFTAGEQSVGVSEWTSSITSPLKQMRASAAPTKPPAEAGIIMPPPKPTIKQIGETSVLVQWTQSFHGMPITFYRIQYKDTDSGRGRGHGAQWVTADHDVKPPTTQYELPGLRPGGSYKFRLAAVYINRDNRVSEATDRVQLVGSGIRADAGSGRRLPPQLVPRLTHLLSQAAGQMFLSWEYLTDPAPIDGFVVQYMPVESHPRVWHENRVAGFNSRNWELRGLLPNTSYQVCVRSENAAGRSPCSNTLMRTTKAESTAGSFDDVLDVLNQPNRGPSPAQTPNSAQGSSGGSPSDGRSSDEDYQPATRGRTSQQPDELLYMVVGVVAGAMMLTLVVFVVACVRRQLVQKRCLTNSPPPPTGEKGISSTGTRTCQRTFNDASRLIFNDVLQQKAKSQPERQYSVAPGLLPLSSDVTLCDGQAELIESHPNHTSSSTNRRCGFVPEASLKYSLTDTLKGICQSKESGFRPEDSRSSGSESVASSLSRRLSSYGCTESNLPEAHPLAPCPAAGGCSPCRSTPCDSEEDEEHGDDSGDCSSVYMRQAALPRPCSPATPELVAETETSSSAGCGCSEPEPATTQRRQSLGSLSIGLPPTDACRRTPSSGDPLWHRGGGVSDYEADGRHRKYDAASYHEDRPFSKQDSAESRPFG